MNTPTRRPQPGVPRRMDSGSMPAGTVPRDPTPRVPPNGQPYVPPEPSPHAHINPTLVREERMPVDAHGKALDSSYERVDLPSNFAFYEWDSLNVRRIKPVDHAKLTRAINGKNLSLVLDVMSSLCDQDVRAMCISDFRALNYWHKFNSYPTTTSKISWMSRYGGRREVSMNSTKLVTKNLEVSRQEYLEWCALGLACPTMRDMELLEGIKDEEQFALFERAQYVFIGPLLGRVAELQAKGDRTPTKTARIEKLQDFGMDFYAKIDEFAEKFNDFGISESCEVLCPQWDARKAVEALRESEIEERMQEADEIELALEQGQPVKPRKEVISLAYNLWSIFPYI
jgi:hypothetical protein